MFGLKKPTGKKYKIGLIGFICIVVVAVVAIKVLTGHSQNQGISLNLVTSDGKGKLTVPSNQQSRDPESASNNVNNISYNGEQRDQKEEKKKIKSSPSQKPNQNEEENLLKVKTYTVKSGDTLWDIAKKHGLHLSTLVYANNLSPSEPIYPGQKLKIYNMDGFTCHIHHGQSLIQIARTYDVSLQEIARINQIEDPNFILAGEKVFVPTVKPLHTFIWPARGRISSGFGWRLNPFTKKGREYHRGIDIAVNKGTPVKASHSGRVIATYRGHGWNHGYGKLVVIRGNDSARTYYAHLSRVLVRRGEHARQGQKIALSGNTGRSTGPHLFFAIVKDGRARNPLKYLP